MGILGLKADRARLASVLGIVLVVVGSGSAWAQTADLPVGNIAMPPVTPEEAEQYLNARVVPTADALPVAPVARTLQANALQSSASSNQPIPAPVLGHELPEGDTTPSGLKRADFAQATTAHMDTSSSIGPNDAAALTPEEPDGQTADGEATPEQAPLVLGTP